MIDQYNRKLQDRFNSTWQLFSTKKIGSKYNILAHSLFLFFYNILNLR